MKLGGDWIRDYIELSLVPAEERGPRWQMRWREARIASGRWQEDPSFPCGPLVRNEDAASVDTARAL